MCEISKIDEITRIVRLRWFDGYAWHYFYRAIYMIRPLTLWEYIFGIKKKR